MAINILSVVTMVIPPSWDITDITALSISISISIYIYMYTYIYILWWLITSTFARAKPSYRWKVTEYHGGVKSPWSSGSFHWFFGFCQKSIGNIFRQFLMWVAGKSTNSMEVYSWENHLQIVDFPANHDERRVIKNIAQGGCLRSSRRPPEGAARFCPKIGKRIHSVPIHL